MERAATYLRSFWGSFALLVILAAPMAMVGLPRLLEWEGRRQPFALSLIEVEPPRSPTFHSAAGHVLHAQLAEDDHWRLPLGLDGINPYLIQATLAAEDQRFYEHKGVDWYAGFRALYQNLRGTRIHSGASTLTMQVVKMASPRPRSLSNKLNQAAVALALETRWSKDEILVAYLNRAPYGGNLAGVEAAALRYFGKPASQLSLPEAALIAGLPKKPGRLNPYRYGAGALARRNHVLLRMREIGYISEDVWEQAHHAPLGVKQQFFMPRTAPHLVARLGSSYPDGTTLHLDASLQEQTELLLYRHLWRFDNAVDNGAVMIMRVPDRAVLAYAGGADFWAKRSGAQVDLATTPRSPGSALKPFLYALALEQQQLYPAEQLLDDTIDFGRYAPANFEGEFNGLLRADEALKYSLNVPAVLLQERLGTDTFYRFLQQAGFTSLHRSAEEYGAGLCLGNGEIRLDEMTAAYASLADQGRWRMPAYVPGAADEEAVQLVSRDTAYLLWTMMEQPFPWEKGAEHLRPRGGLHPVAWKTGTSTGFHDAWAVAYNSHYVVAVWLGNSSGKASPRLVGAEAALPLAARLFRRLPSLAGGARPTAQGPFHRVAICPVSGLPIGQACPASSTAEYPASLLLHRKCRVHVAGPDGQAVTRWPALARGWDGAALPPAATRPDGAKARQLAIQAPVDGSEFLYTGQAGGDRIQLRATRDGDSPIHWYLNGRFIGTSQPHAPLFLDLEPGEHRLSCMTPEGATAVIDYGVRDLRRPEDRASAAASAAISMR